jgi:hypothetical protein
MPCVTRFVQSPGRCIARQHRRNIGDQFADRMPVTALLSIMLR